MADARLGLGLLCVGLAAAANVLGGATVALRREWDDRVLRYCVALSAGFMLAAVLLKMLPESTRLTASAPVLVLAGYLLIHLFEHTVAPHFHFGEEIHPEQMSARVGRRRGRDANRRTVGLRDRRARRPRASPFGGRDPLRRRLGSGSRGKQGERPRDRADGGRRSSPLLGDRACAPGGGNLTGW